MRRLIGLTLGLCVVAGIANAATPSKTPALVDQVNAAEIGASRPKRSKGLDPLLLKAQILLDRARFSPGAIDGRAGDNFNKALAAFRAANGLGPGRLDAEVWAKLSAGAPPAVLITYMISEADLKGPFLERVPKRIEDMVGLERLSYSSTREMLAEKFHVTERLLGQLNPGQRFDKAGADILVPDIGKAKDAPEGSRAARIEVDKAGHSVKAFDKDGKLLGFYPASIGSNEKPAPSGRLEVVSVSENPDYTYNPDYAFKGVKADRTLRIAPGPNNPVGRVWIDLSRESYGIHGTPEPDRVGKTYSHGCVRLTNWDAVDLAHLARKGTEVDFLDAPAR